MKAREATGRAALVVRLLDEATQPLLAADENGTILVANTAAAAALHRDRRHLRGKPFAALVGLEDRRAFRRALLALGSQPVLSVAVRLADDDPGDEPRTLHLHRLRARPPVYAMRIDDGRRLPLPPAPPDDAVRLEVERTLLRLPQAVVGVDSGGRIAFANARARGLLRATPLRRGRPVPEESEGVPLGELVGRLLEAPGPLAPRLLELPDGRTLRVTGTGARADLPAVLVLDDITQHVGRSAVDRLFVQNAAHQLRTPLAGIANAVELLQAGAKEDPVARDRFLAHLERETARLTRLARSLLVLARAQAGVQGPRVDFVELAPVLERIAARLVVPRDVELLVSCPSNLTVLGEPDLLEEALAAIAENAVRHTKRGTISLRCLRRDDGTADVEVRDSGDGILPEHEGALFDPFFRGAPGGTGFGLGLAIASQALAALGARLEVDSAPQRGATFSFRLPAAELVTT